MKSEGQVTFHLYAENEKMSAQDEVILQLVRGRIGSFWKVSIWSG